MTSSPASATGTDSCPRHGKLRADTPSTHSQKRPLVRLGGAGRARTRRCPSPSVAVRKTADGAHRPSWDTNSVRYTSVDTATQRSTARQDDTRRDRAETARIAENSQLAGRLRRWWQVLGSNQRRLSRRFYSTLAPPKPSSADQFLRASRSACGSMPSAMRPCAPGLSHRRGRKNPRTVAVGTATPTVRPLSGPAGRTAGAPTPPERFTHSLAGRSARLRTLDREGRRSRTPRSSPVPAACGSPAGTPLPPRPQFAAQDHRLTTRLLRRCRAATGG